MPGYLETLPFSDRDSEDDAMTWAVLMERGLREIAYRQREDRDLFPDEIPLRQMVPARDAGDVCHICGEVTTWVDHLPPSEPGGAVRCYRNVVQFPVMVDDIFPRVDR